jgi:putative transposase
MLSKSEFEEYCRQIGLSGPAREYVERVRSSEPSRMVGARAKSNTVSFVSSEKMGRTISTESRMPERAFVTLCEHDSRVLEFWDQPEQIKVTIKDKNGRPRSIWYTPDFLVIGHEGVVIVEIKDQKTVEELLEGSPHNWDEGKSGRIEYVPAKKCFAKLGLVHSVFCYRPDLRYKIANLESLLLSRKDAKYTESQWESVQKSLSDHVWMSLYDLKESLGYSDYSPLVQMLDDGLMLGDMDCALISSPKGFLVSLRQDFLDQGLDFINRARPFSQLKEISIGMDLAPSSIRAEKALERLNRLAAGEKSRSARRWSVKVKEGAERGLTPFQSLLPDYHLSGNRNRKAPLQVIRVLDKYLKDEHGPKNGISDYRSYIAYRVHSKDQHPGSDPVSWATFWDHLKKVSGESLGEQRGGKRLANSRAAASPVLYRGLKPSYAWKTASVDHYTADIFIIIFSGGDYVYTARPTITGMIDIYSGAVISMSMSLLPPSRRSVARVMRDCVRKHGRLPSELIVDRGAEFKSVYFASLLADQEVNLSLRPSAHPRFGSEIEGLFGDFKKMWLSGRPGNTSDYKEVRSVDRSFSPDKNAILRPYDLHRELLAFIEWRNNKPVSPGGYSPGYLLKNSQDEFPYIARKVSLDHKFLIASSVETTSYRVDRQRGLHIGEMYYWSPDLSAITGRRKDLEVRPDVENPHLVYAGVGNRWISCFTSRAAEYVTLDPIEQHVQSLEITEALRDKRVIRERADEDLVRMIRDMDHVIDEQSTPVINIPTESEEDECRGDIFKKIRAASVEPLRTESWEVS